MKNIQSFGPVKFYGRLIPLVINDKYSWRKVSNILRSTREMVKPRECVHPANARKSATEYSQQAIKDCRMPEPVKTALKVGMIREFSFTFNA
jgi:hypothetical protein